MEQIRNVQGHGVVYFPTNVCMIECNTHALAHQSVAESTTEWQPGGLCVWS